MTAHSQITFLNVASEYVGSPIDRSLDVGARRLAGNAAKRTVDILGAAIGLLVLLPFLLVVALLICLESRGSPIFKQERTGLRGRTFMIYKFRTMYVCEERGMVVQAIPNDVRVTRLGRILRRSSIDELPQLLNVLRGDMSLVGPRPHAVSHDIHYARLAPRYNSRFLAKPGLTGLAQVSGFRGRTPQAGGTDREGHRLHPSLVLAFGPRNSRADAVGSDQ